ncbi:RAB GDP-DISSOCIATION INHIBITOR [Salix koriyanagi]|uniref:Guanosine nucleotide diphosphate dissociation inhibitor n=1 Tax=Salix koriyanagi TaxID=2511006 RepID=A0A9Q0PN35_9ROSI|nr:RAB GDP-DISSOCIATION INHIBITOR [Salix koriyanagi]
MFFNHVSCGKYGLEDDTIDFIGHALALHLDDSYLDQPALDFVTRMKNHWHVFKEDHLLSIHSMDWQNCLSHLHAEVQYLVAFTCSTSQNVEFDESGKAIGVTSEGEIAKCKKVVCDPSYLPNKVSSTKQF